MHHLSCFWTNMKEKMGQKYTIILTAIVYTPISKDFSIGEQLKFRVKMGPFCNQPPTS